MQEWIDKVTVDLKGADFNKKLVWRTNEGFNVQPMYRLENMQDLKNLDGSRFAPHPTIELPQRRLEALNAVVERQRRAILE